MLSRTDLLVRVSIMYYEEGLTQTAIAKNLNISRPTVASLLQEARDKGIVRINILKPYKVNTELENKIEKKYGIKKVLISPENSSNPKKDVGILCANYIESKSSEFLKIGISFGTTIYEFVQNAKYLDTNFKQIIPLMGGVEMKNDYLHSNFLCYELSSKYSCKVNFFYAPAFAESVEQKQTLMDSNLVKQAIEEARSVDVGIIGVGNPLKNSTYKNLGYLSKDNIAELKKANVVGDICASFFDRKGKEVDCKFSETSIGLRLSDIKKIPEVVILATGTEKAIPIKALLENGFIDVLITDFDIAKNLL